MTCLNCGATGVDAYCPRCGQRHVPREDYDVRGLFVDYGLEVVGSMRILKTLWTLVRHPGRATVDYMQGHRKPQVNPLWLYLFFWSTLITAGQLVLATERADLYAGDDPAVQALMVAIAPWALAVMAYTQPLVGLLGSALGARALATSRWLEAWVFTLHTDTIGLLLSTPAAMAMAMYGLWGAESWKGYLASFVLPLPMYVYSWLAWRGAFGDRLERPFLRWLGSLAVGMAVGIAWTLVLMVALWVSIAVGLVWVLADPG